MHVPVHLFAQLAADYQQGQQRLTDLKAELKREMLEYSKSTEKGALKNPQW